MSDRRKLRELNDRIEPLLDEIRSMASPPVWDRVQEIVGSVVRLYGEGLKRIDEIIQSDGAASAHIQEQLAQDGLVASLLILHGLHPDKFEVRVRKALDHVRPYLGSHGGDVEIVEVNQDHGLVRLRMKGSCDGCPSSLLTVKLAVEGAIKELAPEVARIEVEGITESGLPPPAPLVAPEMLPSWVSIGDQNEFPAGRLASTDAMGSRIVLCRLDGQLYAYRDSCPACGSSMDTGSVSGSMLVCPSCGRSYDARLAGRSEESRELHLEPVPLLEDRDGVRVAVAAP